MTHPATAADAEGIRFWFRGEVRVVTGIAPTMSVLHWLRESERDTGTKEGCNQGDCGACTVVLAELTPAGVSTHTANACLLLMPMLHGRALFTIEDVGSADALHPVQQAMIDSAGSQCGFCTPGFVMSMWRAAESGRASGTGRSRADLADDLSGNLCRCTGYRPILDAAVSASEAVAQEGGPGTLDATVLRQALESIEATSGRLVAGSRGAFLAPASEEELARILRDQPAARVVAGGTDLLLAMRVVGDDLRDDLVLAWTDAIPSMGEITLTGTHLRLGAAVSLDAAWSQIVERLPHLARMQQRFASPAIRSVGTIGGNIANGSPIADLVPILHAVDAEVVCRDAEGVRVVPIDDFAVGVRRNVLRPGEFIARVDIPLIALERDVRAHKVSRRFDDDISTVSGTFAITVDAGTVTEVRAVFGGMAPVVRRSLGVEQALRGRTWSQAALADAVAALDADFEPISDHRASDGYRRRAARGLLERWWRETGADAPGGPTDIWGTQ